MKLLLNNKEIANFLLHELNVDDILKKKGSDITFSTVEEFIFDLNPKMLIEKNADRLYEKIVRAVKTDVENFTQTYFNCREDKNSRYFSNLHKNINIVLDRFGKEYIFEKYKTSGYEDFIKGVGKHLSNDLDFLLRAEYVDYKDDCLIRNTVGNEELLIQKIDNQYPFWFIDSGYTNFLEPNKKWHRLVRNHLHHSKQFLAPVDRLGNFKEFPKKWRESGEYILIIEPGPFAADIFHVDLKTWKYEVEKELKKYTDKKIKFREKAPKKERTPLYRELLDEDYYCIVNINSNAATESIWAGIPAITLDKHITNPVTKNKLSDVNKLYRGSLAEWLCMLSYSQFTKEELLNGKALEILNDYHYA